VCVISTIDAAQADEAVLVGYQTLVGITILIGAVLWCVGNARIVQEIPQQFIPNAGKYVILIGVGNQVRTLRRTLLCVYMD
jgi:hypothetical protein